MSIENDTNDLSFKSGDIIWHLVDDNDYMPFFQCKTFLVLLLFYFSAKKIFKT